MGKPFAILVLALFIGLFAFSSQALAFPFADWLVFHTWPKDLTVWIGVGDPNTPLWETLVQSGTCNFGGIENISGGSSYLWNHQWYLKVYDQGGAPWTIGRVLRFQIRPGNGKAYVSVNHPWIRNGYTSYAFIQMPQDPLIPEPTSLSLLCLGLLGSAFARRRRRG